VTAAFGPVVQNAFVVDDLDAALAHWTVRMGVGPFFVLERVKFGEVTFRGAPAGDIDLTVAIAYWGDLQIELIRQNCATPSIYTEFASARGTGMHHMGVLTDDLDEHLRLLAVRGIEPVQHGATAVGMRFAYVSTDFHPGGMVELIEAGPAVRSAFDGMRAAAARWDGRDPVRRFR
jgi:methylmalonyl-CoA/ethylmalonyl-CoA epimerase